MNMIDKVIAAVTPATSEEAAQAARAKARSLAGKAGWMAQVLDHHLLIEEAFAAVKQAGSLSGRKKAQKHLGLILTGHSIAEESVLYPAMAATGQEGGADELYGEQRDAKVEMAALDALEPMSADYLEKLEEIRAAVAHHVYQEESDYFPRLKADADTATQSKLSRKYKEEYERYVGPAV